MKKSRDGNATFETLEGERSRVVGSLEFATVARLLPLGTTAKVTNLESGRSLIVKINDRGPYTRGRIIDLSPRAAEQLEVKQAGVVPVVVEPVTKGNELGPQRPAPNNRAAATAAGVATPEVREARAEDSATKASPAPAWVDPRIEQPAPNNQAAATPAAAAPEVREARVEVRATEASSAPAWVDPRIERPAPSDLAAATAAPEVREARAEVGATKASPAPAWVDPRIEGP